MRRAVAAIALTVVGLWLVLAYKSSPVTRPGALNATAPNTSVPAPAGAGGRQPPAGSAPPTSTTTGATRPVDGNVVATRFGDVQVAVVLSGGHIVDVKALQLPFDRPRSQSISEQAAPLLRAEVLDVQSAEIDTVSGATYTSDGYARSLQSALDRARG